MDTFTSFGTIAVTACCPGAEDVRARSLKHFEAAELWPIDAMKFSYMCLLEAFC